MGQSPLMDCPGAIILGARAGVMNYPLIISLIFSPRAQVCARALGGGSAEFQMRRRLRNMRLVVCIIRERSQWGEQSLLNANLMSAASCRVQSRRLFIRPKYLAFFQHFNFQRNIKRAR